MQGIILFLCVALAASQHITYQPNLNPKKTYEYRYVGVVTTGHDIAHLPESGLRIRCFFKISGLPQQTYLLQVSNLTIDEFHGIREKTAYRTSLKLTQRLTAELASPVTFQYLKGHLRNIRIAPHVSDSTVSIIKGILEFLQVTIKTTQVVYEVEELGIHGLCRSTYAVDEDLSSGDLHVTQTVDVDNCRERAGFYEGMALVRENKNSKERGSNLMTSVTYRYRVRPTEDGGLLTDVHAKEYQHYSPFNVKGGNSKLQAIKNITLIGVTKDEHTRTTSPADSEKPLYTQTSQEVKNANDAMDKVSKLIDHLSKATLYQFDSNTGADVLELYRLLRKFVTVDKLEGLWRKYSGSPEQRRWLLDVIPEITDTRVISFLKNRFQTRDITANEATQTILLTFNHLTASSKTVEMCKEFLTMPFTKSSDILWNTAALSYGSLVYRYCGTIDQCPVTAVQPLVDLASSSLSAGDEKGMVLALKALGNAGHPSSLKIIMKFLPGVSPTAKTLPIQVQSAAVQSLRHIAVRDPHRVQGITLNMFMQRSLSSEIRMLTFQVLFETEPPFALVSTVTALLLEETDLQVASFSYSLIKGLARSQMPDNNFLSTACNVACKILTPKLGHLSFRYSKAFHFDWFDDKFLLGSSADIYMIKNTNSFIPSTLISRMKIYFIQRILETAEIGVQSEGIQQLLNRIHSIASVKPGISYMEAVLKALSELQSLPKKTPLLSAFARLFGQEVFYADINSDMIQSLMHALSPTAGSESPVWKIVSDIQEGLAWNWTKPYLIFETRYMYPTILGLPAEISKYYLSVTGITANAAMKPAATDKPGQLLDADMYLETDGSASYTKDIYAFYGINADIVQSGVEFKCKVNMYVPWNFTLKMNLKENKFQLNTPPIKNDTDVFSINHNVYVVSSNIEEPDLAKRTPVVPEAYEVSQNDEPDNQTAEASEQGQTSVPEESQFQAKRCVEAKLYGLSVCIELDEKRPHYLSEYPLYYILGKKECTIKLEPVETDKNIERLQLEINTGANKEIPKLCQSAKNIHTGETTKLLEAQPDPAITVTALAVSGSEECEGYEAVAYFTQTSRKDDLQLILSQVGEESNWRACVCTNVDSTQKRTEMQLQWGAECQTYKMSIMAETVHTAGSKPSLNTTLNWEDVPERLQEIGTRIQEYIPGVALLLSLHEEHENNPDHEISASVTPSAPESIDIKIRAPELTVYKQDILFPHQIPFEEMIKGFSIFPSALLQEKNGLCTISGDSFRTFDSIRFTSALPKGCYFVLVKDCTTDDIQVLMKGDIEEKKEIFIITPSGSVNLDFTDSGVSLKVNDSSIPLSSLPQTDPSGTLLMYKSENGVVIQAPTLGLSSVSFDGDTVEVEVEWWLKTKVCGVCGQADEGSQSGFRNEDLLIGRNPISFLTTWMEPRTNYSDTCQLQQQHVEMEQMLDGLDAPWTCSSTESVLRCRDGCSPTNIERHPYDFTCAPAGVNQSEPLTYDSDSVVLEKKVDTHVSCLCNSD